MSQPGVCPIAGHGRMSCPVNVLFVVGKGVNTSASLDGDVLMLPSPDGNRCYGVRHHENFEGLRLKVTMFLHYMSTNFPQAKWIGRVDEDYYPYLSASLPRLLTVEPSKEPFQFLGKQILDPYYNCGFSMDEIYNNVTHGLAPKDGN